MLIIYLASRRSFYTRQLELEGATLRRCGEPLELAQPPKSWHSSLYLLTLLIGFDSDALNIFTGLLSRAPCWAYYGTPVVTLDLIDLPVGRIELELGSARGRYWSFMSTGDWTHLP